MLTASIDDRPSTLKASDVSCASYYDRDDPYSSTAGADRGPFDLATATGNDDADAWASSDANPAAAAGSDPPTGFDFAASATDPVFPVREIDCDAVPDPADGRRHLEQPLQLAADTCDLPAASVSRISECSPGSAFALERGSGGTTSDTSLASSSAAAAFGRLSFCPRLRPSDRPPPRPPNTARTSPRRNPATAYSGCK